MQNLFNNPKAINIRWNYLFIFTLICFSLASCNNDYKYTNKRIAEIDALPFNDDRIELLTDSIGNVLDTLSILSRKTDENGDLVYEELYEKEYSEVNYLLSRDELFRQEIEDKTKQLTAVLNSKLNKDKLILESSMVTVDRINQVRDTTILEYSYKFYDNSKTVKTSKVKSYMKGNKKNSKQYEFAEYNSQGKLIKDVRRIKSDTLEQKQVTYNSSGNMIKLVKIFPKLIYGSTVETVTLFFENGESRLSDVFYFENGEKYLAESTTYSLDEKMRRSKSVKTIYSLGKVEYHSYLYDKKISNQ